MAEPHKGGSFSKGIAKRFVRTKEKVLQNLGKADRTTDDVFDENVTNFNRQQASAQRLQKELKTYLVCVKEMAAASKSLYSTIQDIYEPEWVEHGSFEKHIESQDLIWTDYLNSLTDSVQGPLATYISQYPEYKSKISKRGRKLVDYDSARHNLDSLKNAKKRDETKIMKAQEELASTKKVYEDLNYHLHDELPDLYDNRISFYTGHFETLFTIEEKFHRESGKTRDALNDAIKTLAVENDKGTYKTKKLPQFSRKSGDYNNGSTSPSSLPTTPVDSRPDIADTFNVNLGDINGESRDDSSPTPAPRPSLHESEEVDLETPSKEQKEEAPSQRYKNGLYDPVADPGPSSHMNGPSSEDSAAVTMETSRSDSIPLSPQSEPQGEEASREEEHDRPYEPVDLGAQLQEDRSDRSSPEVSVTHTNTEVKVTPNNNVHKNSDKDNNAYSLATDIQEDVYKVPESNQPVKAEASLPAGVLFQVRATHAYQGEDSDELSFEAGDLVNVIPFEDPEDQDDGWLMGNLNGKKGVFPENFTKRI
ncbi:unnamed protein product [Owenia fusiformis]|uniref:Uncharacterized protein n=1 Tax=Owenia fusiformis TaxID=6347 RepID=A0A8J1XQP9_OWEFU|nr:unnamed protein product [Owenia fusiformis]